MPNDDINLYESENLKNKKLAFLGLGVMGFPMAGHLLKTGCDLKVFNRSPKKVEEWSKQHKHNKHFTIAQSPREAAQGADFVFTCVGNDDDLREIMLSENGVFEGLKAGAIICDHTTSSAKVAKELNELANAKNVGFLDAPVSGGQAGAENGALSIMVGGEKEHFELAVGPMSSYGKMMKLIGPSGSGQLCKMVNQICITGILQGLSEALVFGEKAGLDMSAVTEVIGQGAAQSWQLDNRAETMLQNKFEFGFAVDWMRKDLAIVLEEAKALNLDLVLTEMVDTYYKEVQTLGGSRWDTSSLITRLKNKN